MSTTPEPRSPGELRTPDAPRYGPMFDDYEPYAPRKSARVAQRVQRDEVTTPPPPPTYKGKAAVASTPMKNDPFTSASTPTTSMNKSTMSRTVDLLSPPTTGRATRSQDVDSFEDESKDDTIMTGTGSATRSMLPTPIKTPTSGMSTIEPAAIKSVARNLFNRYGRSNVDEAMPTPRKKGRKKLTGFEITSDGEEEAPAIKIYTDTKDRIPEVDDSPANAFYTSSETPRPQPATKATKRRKVASASAGPSVAQHTYGPSDMSKGAVFVFRGKKFWRSLEKREDDAAEEVDPELQATIDDLLPPKRPSDPRKWLFGENPRLAREKAEEEAATDIEEESYHKTAGSLKHKSAKTSSKIPIPKIIRPSTPTRPTTPTTTTRVTRAQTLSRSREDGGEGAGSRGRSRSGATSPFDHWSRTRSPLNDPTSLGSPTRKPRGMTTRSAASRRRV